MNKKELLEKNDVLTKALKTALSQNGIYANQIENLNRQVEDLQLGRDMLMHEMIETRGMLNEMRNKEQWISVFEALPPPSLHVLVYMPLEEPWVTVCDGWINKNGVWHAKFRDLEPNEVVYWRLMPMPPKEEEHE